MANDGWYPSASYPTLKKTTDTYNNTDAYVHRHIHEYFDVALLK